MSLSKLLFADKLVKDDLVLKVAMKMPSNLLLHGSNGTGKTTIARQIVEDLGLQQSGKCEFNGTDFDVNTMISVLNMHRMNTGNNGLIILNEVDHLSPKQQYELQTFIDTYCSDNTVSNALCKVVLTTNNIHKVMPAIKSRCSDYHIKGPTPSALMPMFSSKLKDAQVQMAPSIIKQLLDSELPEGCRYLSYRDVEALFTKTVFQMTGRVVKWSL